MWTRICLVFVLSLVAAAAWPDGYGPIPLNQQLHSPDADTPLAWHFLKQWNTGGPMLVPLSHQMRPLLVPSRRGEAVWTGENSDTRLTLEVLAEGELDHEVFVGFFADATWSGDPLQMRSFPGPGRYEITDLPPGDYVVGAMMGAEPVHIALGVHETWPNAVSIRSGESIETRILMSKDFDRSLYIYNDEIARGYAGQWDATNPRTMVHGRVLGPAGTPVSYAFLGIREHKPGANSIAAPDTGADRSGNYYYDEITWPYFVFVHTQETVPASFGYRHQSKKSGVLEGPQRVDFQFDKFPTGTASLHGTAIDQHGKPLDAFTVSVFQQSDEHVVPEYSIAFRFPFMRSDGTFDIEGIPPGEYRVMIIPFDQRPYDYFKHEKLELQDGAAETRSYVVNAKTLYYGKVDFGDTPPIPRPGGKGAHVTMWYRGSGMGMGVADLDAEGGFAIYLSSGESEALKNCNAKLSVSSPPGDDAHSRSVGDFPFELLSENKDQPGVLKATPLELLPQDEAEPAPKTEGLSVELKALTLTAITGERFDIAKLEGKVVLINVFATWCGPCNEEIPHLKKLHEEFFDNGLRIVAVSRKEEAKTVEDFVQSKGIAYTVLLDPDGKGTDQFKADDSGVPVPTNIILDRELEPVFQEVGYTKEKFESLRAKIEELLR